MALRVPEMCFWPAKTRKNLNFLRCIHVFDLVLKYCSDINEENWLQLLFYFNVLICVVASNIGMSFFFILVSGFRLTFSRIAVSRKPLQVETKTDLTTTALFLEFFVGICPVPSISFLIGLK